MVSRGQPGGAWLATAFAVSVFFAVGAARAQTSDTWLLNPPGSDYNGTSNWVSNTVPDNGGTATFGGTAIRTITISSDVSPGGFTFNSGAASYTFTLGGGVTLSFSGAGVVNNSSNAQTFSVGAEIVNFNNSSNAGPSSVTYDVTTGGTINFNDSSNAGSAHFTIDGSGTTLNFDDNSSAGSGTFTVTNGGFMCFCNNATAGSSSITLSGTGTQLQLNDGTSLGTATITNGTGATVQILGDVTGNSARYIGSGGTLDITGATTSFSIGSIEGSGTVDLDSNNLTTGATNLSTTFSGVIQGSGGTLTKTGTGTLTLSGTNTYTGATTVSQGALMLTGSLTSSVTVNSGATFGGTGTVTGNVTNNGTVAPGTIGSPMTINGNYTQGSGGTYQVALNSSGSTRLVVNGTANLGGSLSVQAGSSYAIGTPYTILTATAISGTFASTTSNFAFLTPVLGYNSNSVMLTLAQAANAFQRAAQSGNQGAVGGVLDRASAGATGDFRNVINALLVLDTVQGPRTLDVIGGQNYSGFSTVAVQSALAFMNAFARQAGGGDGGNGHQALASGGDDGACDAACDIDLQRWGVWGGGLGGAGTVAGDAGSHGTTYGFGGFAAGLDYRFDPSFMAGVTVGYTSANLYTQGMDGTGRSGTVQMGLYGELTRGQIYLDGLAGYARGQNQMQRPIAIPGLAVRTASSQTTVDQFFGQLETGYKIDLGGRAQAFFTPFARLQASTAAQAAFTETGADSLNLNVAGQTTNSLRTVLGAVLGGAIGKATTKVRLGWSHEFADTARPVTASFAGAPALSFTTTGAAAPREGAVLGLSVDAPLAEQTSLYARYDAELAGGNTSHVFSAGVRYVW